MSVEDCQFTDALEAIDIRPPDTNEIRDAVGIEGDQSKNWDDLINTVNTSVAEAKERIRRKL